MREIGSCGVCLVHRQQLLDQWHDRLTMFLGLPPKSIGQIGGGKMDRTGGVDIAVIQSLHRKDEVKDFVAAYGQVIVNECHHISAFTFERENLTLETVRFETDKRWSAISRFFQPWAMRRRNFRLEHPGSVADAHTLQARRARPVAPATTAHGPAR